MRRPFSMRIASDAVELAISSKSLSYLEIPAHHLLLVLCVSCQAENLWVFLTVSVGCFLSP